MKNINNEKYGRLTVLLLITWLALSITASAWSLFHAGSKHAVHPPLPLGLAVIMPVLLFALWFAASPEFRRFALSLNVRTLTIVQSWRIGGFVFLILYARGILPAVFALPAGWGDIAIGATAPFVALYLTREAGRKKSFIAWQLFGILDLVVAVSMGVLASPTPVGMFARGITTDVMTTLPLSLIPTFAVPLLMVLHIISIAQAARWQTQRGIETAHHTIQASPQ